VAFSEKMNKILIFAYKYKGEFYPEYIVDDLDMLFSDLEYGDVFEGNYQIWEYPSGKINKIESDRKVDDKNYYSTPYTDKGTIWLPKLSLIRTDKDKVADAYDKLKNTPKKKSLLQRVKDLIRH
jgi:hypothetical protein